MGSLMGGWDCPVYDPKAVKYMRNKSLTKGKIEAYWKEKKETEQEHLQALSPRSQSAFITSLDQESSRIEEWSNVKKKNWRSNSLPADLNKQDDDDDDDEDEDLRKLILKKNCWWTRSNWAFLNEPPVIAGEPQYKYASQYHLAAARRRHGSATTLASVDCPPTLEQVQQHSDA